MLLFARMEKLTAWEALVWVGPQTRARDPVEVAGPLGTPLGLAQRKRRLDSLEAAQGAP